MQLQAIICDWAGTTVDFGCFAPVAVFVEVFRRQGVSITTAEARTPMGLQKRDHIRTLAHMPDVHARWQTVHHRPPAEADIDAMYADSVVVQTQSISAHADVIPGCTEAIAACRARGLKIGSTTGYSRAVMDILHPLAAAAGYAPDTLVVPDDVPKGRPAPWMMYMNAMRLNIYPMATVVKVGDTVPDIEEGRNAGAWTVGISMTGNELGLSAAEVAALAPAELTARLDAITARLYEASAHYVVRSIADLPLLLDTIDARLAAGERP
ncbi:MAG: phosphonoacetaldehyde hydrolase [Chloroflexota bacterium]|nr:phosphonoacetaldehyde hydrolase [Chloroflexota bacterium]